MAQVFEARASHRERDVGRGLRAQRATDGAVELEGEGLGGEVQARPAPVVPESDQAGEHQEERKPNGAAKPPAKPPASQRSRAKKQAKPRPKRPAATLKAAKPNRARRAKLQTGVKVEGHERFHHLRERERRVLTGGDDGPEARVRAAMISTALFGAASHPLVADLDADVLRRHLYALASQFVERTSRPA